MIIPVAILVGLASCWYAINQSNTQPINLPPRPHLDQNNRLNIDPSTNQSTLEFIYGLIGPESIVFHPIDDTLMTGCYDGSINQVRLIDGPIDRLQISTLTYTGAAALQNMQLTDRPINQSTISDYCHLNTHDPWTCGRPLGLEYLDASHLIIADAYHGLLEYALGDDVKNGSFRVLWNDSMCDTNSVTVVRDRHVSQSTNQSTSQSINQANDWIYFTSASCVYRNNVVVRNAVSGTCTGSLRRVRVDGSISELLVDRLCFANGVIAMYNQPTGDLNHEKAEKQSTNPSIIVAITDRAQIISYDPTTGEHDVVADNLPCLPDNLHIDAHNASRYWFGCGGPLRHSDAFSMFDWLGQKTLVRSFILTFVPYSLLRMFTRHDAMIVHMERVNASSHRIIETLQDLEGRLKIVTSAAEHGEYIWMTSYLPEVDYLARIKRPE